jgi:hypothetical protein
MLARTYSTQLGFRIDARALRATAVTNALDNRADIAKAPEWLTPWRPASSIAAFWTITSGPAIYFGYS